MKNLGDNTVSDVQKPDLLSISLTRGPGPGAGEVAGQSGGEHPLAGSGGVGGQTRDGVYVENVGIGDDAALVDAGAEVDGGGPLGGDGGLAGGGSGPASMRVAADGELVEEADADVRGGDGRVREHGAGEEVAGAGGCGRGDVGAHPDERRVGGDGVGRGGGAHAPVPRRFGVH